MKIKIDTNKINGKIFNIFKPHWICKATFVGSVIFLIHGDTIRTAKVSGANYAGYMVVASSSLPNWEPSHSRLDTNYNSNYS